MYSQKWDIKNISWSKQATEKYFPGYVIPLQIMVYTVLFVYIFRSTPVKIHDAKNSTSYVYGTDKNTIGE